MADEARVCLVSDNTRIRVSSVLNKNVKEYGKKYMFDGKDETCWNSDQGSPQFVIFEFPQEVNLKRICIQFQGGFAGKECQLEGGPSSSSLTPFHQFYPDDVNTLQIFPVDSCKRMKVLKIIFLSSTDFFGRITIYKLDLFGSCVSS